MSRPSYEPSHCVVCGHADAREIANAEDVRAEVERLWEYHQRRLRPGVPPQHLMDRVAFSEHPPFRLVECRECGLVYRNPTERAHELHDVYAGEPPAADVLRSLHETQRASYAVQARTLRELLGRGGSGLEVGSYVGAFLAAARRDDLRVEGVDINAGVNAFARSLGFVVHDGDIESFAEDRVFDAVAIWNAFDQLPEPRAALAAAVRHLAPGGVLAIRVPNGAFYSAWRRRASGAVGRALLAQNNLLGFPYRWGFTPRSLGTLMEELGLTVVRTRGDVLVPIADEWTRGWARIEERAIKRVSRWLISAGTLSAPWFEVYARRL